MRRLHLSSAAVAMVVVACGGKLSPAEPSTIEEVPTVASSVSTPVTCDGHVTEGARCIDNGDCEVGDDILPSCNVFFRCKDGTWRRDSEPAPGCPSLRADDDPTCPKRGHEGETACRDSRHECHWDDGHHCRCLLGKWECAEPRAGCPSKRPRYGTQCREPRVCLYTFCSGAGNDGAEASCIDGLWQSGCWD